MKPPILDYETPPPRAGMLQRIGELLCDRGRMLCAVGLGLLLIEPALPNGAREVGAIIALGCLMFGAGISGDSQPFT